MTDTVADIEIKIARMTLAPGDVLVIKTAMVINMMMRERIRADVDRFAPGTQVLFVDPGMEISILSPAATP